MPTLDPILPFARIDCVKGCGWHRDYTLREGWKHDVIAHPQWGNVTQWTGVLLDVQNHNCETYIEAVTKLREAQQRASITISANRQAGDNNSRNSEEVAGKQQDEPQRRRSRRNALHRRDDP